MCQSCNEVSVNGVNCHEIGCPEAKDDYAKRAGCQWCGSKIKQDSEEAIVIGNKAFCDEDCVANNQ